MIQPRSALAWVSWLGSAISGIEPMAGAPTWHFSKGSRVTEVTARGWVSHNNGGMLLILTKPGMGIATLPARFAHEAVAVGRPESVLATFGLPGLRVHAVIVWRLEPLAVRAFLDFVLRRLVLA